MQAQDTPLNPGAGVAIAGPKDPHEDHTLLREQLHYQDDFYRDKCCALPFLAVVVAVLITAFSVGVPALASSDVIIGMDDDFTPFPTKDLHAGQLLLILSVTAICSAVASAAVLLLLARCAKKLLVFGTAMSVVGFLVCTVAACFYSAWFALPGALLCLVAVLVYFGAKDRAAFAGANLQVAATAIRAHPGTIYAAFGLLLAQLVWTIMCVIAVIGLYNSAVPNDPEGSYGGTIFLIIMVFLFVLFWGLEFLRFVEHTLVAGVVGTWWVAPTAPDPTCGALKRALTTSFGSIAMGAGLVSFFKMVRVLLDLLRGAARHRRRRLGRQDCCQLCLLGCASCIVRAMEDAVRWYSDYAFVQVALYGLTFRQAGHDAFNTFARIGWLTLLNDFVVDRTLAMLSVMVGCVTFVIGGGMAYGMFHEDEVQLNAIVLTCAFGSFVVGYFMCSVVSAVVESATKAVYVCLADRPQDMLENHPQQWQELMDAWVVFAPELLQSAEMDRKFQLQGGGRGGGGAGGGGGGGWGGQAGASAVPPAAMYRSESEAEMFAGAVAVPPPPPAGDHEAGYGGASGFAAAPPPQEYRAM